MAMRKPKPNERTEWFIKDQVKRILTDTGWNWWMPNAGVFGRSGVSDFLAVKPPKLFMAIETKYDDVATVLQLKFLKGIHDAGHFAFLVDETNIEELRRFLTTPGLNNPVSAMHLKKWQTQMPYDIQISKGPKKKVTEHHADTPADPEHSTKTKRPVTGSFHPAWDESGD